MPWDGLVAEMENRNGQPYFRKMIKSHLNERSLITDNGQQIEVICEIPQRSILGSCTCTKGGYIRSSTDLAIIIGRSEAEVIDKVNQTLQQLNKWMVQKGLNLALHKI